MNNYKYKKIIIYLMKKNDYEKLIFTKLYTKYKIDNTIYSSNVIENILFNDKSHLVSKFKDYLIMDDIFEYFQRYYNSKESFLVLQKILNYYSKKNMQYPNYSRLREADIILKNINSKRQMIKNLENSIKGKKKSKSDLISNEKLNNTVFNSKVYDSIINDSENGLSIFSNDKESLYSGYSLNSKRTRDDGINKLIDNIEMIVSKNTFSFKNTKDKTINHDEPLIKDANLNKENNLNNNKDTKFTAENLQKIYKKKKTPNNSINRRKNIECNSCKIQKPNFPNKNDNMDYTYYKSLLLLSEKNYNLMNNISKKINIGNKINNSALSSKRISRDNFGINNIINYQKKIEINKSPITASKLNNNIKIDQTQEKPNLLTERVPSKIKVKINMDKNYKTINHVKNKSYIRNKNQIIKYLDNQKQKIRIDKTKFLFLIQKINLENKDNLNNKNKNFGKMNIANNNNTNFVIKTIEKLDTYRSNPNKLLKDNKIKLFKKKDYIINEYKNKSSNYNNFTSIQFNNNNINIINSTSKNINNNANNIFNNTYENSFQRPDEINIHNNLSNFDNKRIDTNNNKRKKLLNKTTYTYDIYNNGEKLNQRFKFNKKLKNLDNLNLIDNNTNINTNMNSLPQYYRTINSQRISTPFSSRLNKKMIFKIYNKENLTKNKQKKNFNILQDEYQKLKKNLIDKQKYDEIDNNDNFYNFNIESMSLLDKTNTNFNSSNFNNSNYFYTNSSLLKKSKHINDNDFIYYKKIDNTEILKNKLKMNISRTLRQSKNTHLDKNNLETILKIKRINKDDDLMQIRKLDEKKKKIICQFNEKLNQIKLKFIKDIENKFEISKRKIMNKRKNKNKLNVKIDPDLYK